MDVDTVDREYGQLEQQAQQTVGAIQQLATKMQAAGEAGDTQAREWVLDLKSIALQIQQEQLQVQTLLQALHSFALNNMQEQQQMPMQQAPQVYQQAPPQVYQQAPPQVYQQAPQGQGGGVMSRFTHGAFGQAMTQGVGMGAGFGLAETAISAIFGR